MCVCKLTQGVNVNVIDRLEKRRPLLVTDGIASMSTVT